MAENKRLAEVMCALQKKAAEFGVTLIDTELVREGKSRYLRLFIDKAGGVSLDDCESYHRSITALVDEIDFDYLEVCSPGLDRPLKKKSAFDTHLGKSVEVHLYKPKTANGSKLHIGKLIGTAADGESVVSIRIQNDNEVLEFSMNDVSLVRPYITFEEDELNIHRIEPEVES